MPARQVDRRAELARIHILAKQLNLPRDEYEDIVFSIGRVRSSGDLGAAGRGRLIEHLASLAGKYEHAEWAFVDTAAPDRRPLLRKIMMQLRSTGRRRAYAEGITRRMFGIERLTLCAPDQLRRVVSALVYDQRRSEQGET